MTILNPFSRHGYGFGMLTIAAAALIMLAPAAARAQMPTSAEHDAIAYTDTSPTDLVARLQARIDAGEVQLKFDPVSGYLPSVLEHLEVPVSSQSLVFSKTSLQVDRIAPWRPRAIYFNDDVYVGWVQEGPVMEFASVDPNLGTVFYTLRQDEDEPPQFQRETGICLMCHDSSSSTGGVPGLILRSTFTDSYGYPVSTIGPVATTDRTSVEDRWGGWYVTGKHGTQAHRGNTRALVPAHEVGSVDRYLDDLDVSANANVTDLSNRFNTEPYLSPHSDIIALMVLGHQAWIHNLITIANFETSKELHTEDMLREVMGLETNQHLETTLRAVRRSTEPLVRGMLFVRETHVKGPFEGTSGFAEEFQDRGPYDSQGRSLREMDLDGRLFRYPLSYLIYTESFNRLPQIVKDYVYTRLSEVLEGEDTSKEFAHLSADDRKAILEILEDTKPDFSAFRLQAIAQGTEAEGSKVNPKH